MLPQILSFGYAFRIQQFADCAKRILSQIVSDLPMSFDHLRRFLWRSEMSRNRLTRSTRNRQTPSRAPTLSHGRIGRRAAEVNDRPTSGDGRYCAWHSLGVIDCLSADNECLCAGSVKPCSPTATVRLVPRQRDLWCMLSQLFSRTF